MKIVVIDNYDSFTYNLVHLVEKITNTTPTVLLNDKFKLEDINQYDKIILSPGPGVPSDAGLLMSVIKKYAHSKSILGVCLGHQAIAEAFGGSLQNIETVYHGVATNILVTDVNNILFKNMPALFKAGRYHSWVVNKNTLPKELIITAIDDEGTVMAMEHMEYNIYAVQFHPESILTEFGETIMRNWIENC